MRTIVNIVLTLYTVRLVLSVLGVNDFGIYTIVAGVVSMLSFVTDALVSTTQRFVSYYQGRNNISQLKEVISNSIFIHIGLGLISILLFEAIGPVLFNYVIEIPAERIIVAKELYHYVVLMVFVTFVTSPFKALLISHENIVFISIVDIIDGLLKLLFALLLFIIPYDKLVFYGLTMLIVRLFNLLTFAIYSYVKYEECIISNISYFRIEKIREMFSFAGWNIYSTACLIGRQQGVAIVINRFMGTVANAAYGVGFQLAGNMNFLSVSLANSIRPQIMKAEGAGDRARALWLTSLLCKFSYFLMAAVCIPCMFEIKTILSLWLE
ncbi:MAG: hypothetical protein IJT98_08735, partial [Prevotella sp.]|nr:hypothetical protein [Prevotella sp.]